MFCITIRLYCVLGQDKFFQRKTMSIFALSLETCTRFFCQISQDSAVWLLGVAGNTKTSVSN